MSGPSYATRTAEALRSAHVSMAFCLLAALIEFVLVLTSAEHVKLHDIGGALALVAPYAAFAFLAWHLRQRRPALRLLFVVAAVFCLWGIAAATLDSVRYHSEPHYAQLQRMDVVVASLARWLGLLAFAFLLLVSCCIQWWLANRSQ